MDYPEKCPTCLMRWPDIRGMIFSAGGNGESHRCENPWHLGEDYDPDVLKLTDKDRELLASLKISI